MHQKQQDATSTTSQQQQQQQQQHSSSAAAERDSNNNSTYTIEQLPELVLESLLECLGTKELEDYSFDADVLSGVGENSYGLVVRTKFTLCTPITALEALDAPAALPAQPQITRCIVKMAPENQARRKHMCVADYYAREVFMYDSVFSKFAELAQRTPNAQPFDIAPAFYGACLNDREEFLVVEDLIGHGYRLNARQRLPSYDLVACAVTAVAKLHAMSFVLRAQAPQQFDALIARLRESLFSQRTEAVTWEFGRNSLRRTRKMLANEMAELAELAEVAELAETQQTLAQYARMREVLEHCEQHFEQYALHCVDGNAMAPYAVICHGDFWNNNILYKFNDANTAAIDAKLIDFQMCRYAAPVLDLVHYLYACTDKELRDAHFFAILDTYYDALCAHLRSYGLEHAQIYPRHIFVSQLQEFGAFGLVMSAFAVPFFISHASEWIDLDQVCEDMHVHYNNEENESKNVPALTATPTATATPTPLPTLSTEKCREIIDEYDMLNERTLPIFKRRMTDIVRDLIKYKMDEKLYQLANKKQRNTSTL